MFIQDAENIFFPITITVFHLAPVSEKAIAIAEVEKNPL